jgi:hypothetical protein
MRGIVFTEFLDQVEEKFSAEMVDTIIESSDLPSKGAYTSLGTYDHSEMVQLVSHLSQETDIPIPELLRTFGEHLFTKFHASYPVFFEGINHAFDFLKNVEDYIHVEVRKLYPDAELPKIDYETPSDNQLVMIYSSSRPFGDLAEGLISGCIKHFGNSIGIARENLETNKITKVRFTLTEQSP